MPGFLLHVASVKSRPGFSHLEWTPSPSLWQEVGGPSWGRLCSLEREGGRPGAVCSLVFIGCEVAIFSREIKQSKMLKSLPESSGAWTGVGREMPH